MGPTGTGKEHVARALHCLSRLADRPFVVINCTAIVETLFESELFGYVRGAFTGAAREKIGLFEYADKGTLFLDEIGDMPLTTQAKLLRVLQNQEVQRLGSLVGRKVDVRIVAATNRNLRNEVERQGFREDLFYRLAMVEIHTPGLKERGQDLFELAEHFLVSFSQSFGKDVKRLSAFAREALERHNWPGHVRELQNVIGRGCMMCEGEEIELEDLPRYFAEGVFKAPQGEPALEPMGDGLTRQEQRLIERALEKAAGNQTSAARMPGVSRDRLRYRMKKYGLLDSNSSAASPVATLA